MEATFDNTVNILVNAYLNGTLLKDHCCACAVGNICAAAIGSHVINIHKSSKFRKPSRAKWSIGSPRWPDVFMMGYGTQHLNPSKYEGEAKAEIDATGYSWQQLAAIEKAFEGAQKGDSEEAAFSGLMAVVDVLASIHGVDLAQAETAKSLFVKA